MSSGDILELENHNAAHPSLKYAANATIKHWLTNYTRQVLSELNMLKELEGQWDVVDDGGVIKFKLKDESKQ